MFTTLDNSNGSCAQTSATSRFGWHTRRWLVLTLVVAPTFFMPTTGCVAPEIESGDHTSYLLSGNGLTPEDLVASIPAASALVNAALADTNGVLDQNTAGTLATTVGGQHFLRHAIECALDDGDSVSNPGAGPASFSGNLGLAPAWLVRGLTASEMRALSACLLAHVNAFGEQVSVSIRNPALLGVEPGEIAQYDFHEATFYGDLFASTPAMYVCTGQPVIGEPPGDRAQRVCSDSAAPGSSETLCGFELVGSCNDVCDTSTSGNHDNCWNSAARDDSVFPESMNVWLSMDE